MAYPIRNAKILSRTLEYSAAYWCNLRCAHCVHLTPYATKPLPSLSSFAADLERLAPVLHTPEFRLLGGEPLLNPALTEMARLVQASGIADTVSVTTNGVLLHRMDDAVWEQIDTLRVTLYPTASPSAETMAQVAQRARETNTRLCVTPRPEFRAVILTEPQPDDLTARLIYTACESAHVCQYLIFSEGMLFQCAVPLGIGEYLRRMGRPGYEAARDGLDLCQGGDLLARLQEFLSDRTPRECCRYCLGYAGIDTPHQQLTRAELDNPALRPATRTTHLSRARLLRGLVVRGWGEVKGWLGRRL